MRTPILSACLCLVVLVGSSLGIARAASELLETRAVPLAEGVKPGARIGRLRFLGMLELPDIRRDGTRLSQLSGLAWDEDDGVLYAVSDRGYLFHLVPEFEGDVLARVRLKKAVILQDPISQKTTKRKYFDTEGLDILYGRNGRKGDAQLIISFERVPLVARYDTDGRVLERYALPEALNDVKHYQNPNKMLESVCVDPALGILTVPELPLRDEFNHTTRIFSLSGRFWQYPVEDDERITDMACLGQGDVLLLQQHSGMLFNRIVVSLKRVHLSVETVGQELKPESVARLDTQQGHQLDNFEGLARHRGRRFFMVSDNNDLFIQRTLLMYFELLPE